MKLGKPNALLALLVAAAWAGVGIGMASRAGRAHLASAPAHSSVTGPEAPDPALAAALTGGGRSLPEPGRAQPRRSSRAAIADAAPASAGADDYQESAPPPTPDELDRAGADAAKTGSGEDAAANVAAPSDGAE